jgi:hypothetical protein
MPSLRTGSNIVVRFLIVVAFAALPTFDLHATAQSSQTTSSQLELVTKIEPVYPTAAIASQSEGTIVLSATITDKGAFRF